MEETVIDYTIQLEELILQSQTYNNNLITMNNNLIGAVEMLIIVFGLFIGLFLMANIVKVIFK